ncbi:unnamed protein product [Vitrella brassicaformis CCMP3155]|uniref:Radial spoke head protein 9 homolog n=2 Tax=Vitrella brassicaformis TaxID=1169539 RepID=A0A0G4EMC0_VITBC|nr:unnamed protein product [Vitrella brassicaformis CCMP3155]|eukprot:CEL98140.1 unnamed protein product [Vitrella brassicaformis CCMP3155]
MELAEFEYGLDQLASHGVGIVLNVHEKACLKVALVKLQQQQNLRQLYFWGKILTAGNDYYIAAALQEGLAAFPTKKFYWSGPSFDFAELPGVDGEVSKLIDSAEARGPFFGTPDRLLGKKPGDEEEEVAAEGGGEGEEGAPPPPMKVREVHRLSHVVRQIDNATAVVPKGSHAVLDSHKIIGNFAFKGLSFKDAMELESWVHFRPPHDVAKLRALSRDDVQFHSDFLEGVEDDLPIGSWTLRADPSCETVTIRSLLWPGYVAYHKPCTRFFGGCYFGTGEQLVDLPFLLC